MKPEIIVGDLFETKAKYLCHQCNCVSKASAHLAWEVFKRYPYANIYATRKEFSIPGDILVCGNGEDKRYVIDMFGQFYPGFPKYPDSTKDGSKAREQYFQQCLDKISEIKDLHSLAFPWKIGCGAAGGYWYNYFSMIQKFGDKVDAKVYVYQLSGEK